MVAGRDFLRLVRLIPFRVRRSFCYDLRFQP